MAVVHLDQGPGLHIGVPAGPPPEDAGSATASWYRYQYSVTAAQCLELLLRQASIIVEWHTDYVVTDPQTLVSVKHRSLSEGAWTLAAICASGALSTLRDRWVAAGKQWRCEMRTNAGFSAAKNDARALATALVQGKSAQLPNEMLQKLAGAMGCPTEDAIEFLNCLTIVSTGGDAETIDGIVVERAIRPLFEALRLDPNLARAAYRATLELVREVAAGCTDSPETWASAPYLGEEVRLARTIDAERLMGALAKAGVVLDIGVEGGVVHRGNTRLVRKLRAGGLGQTVLSSAPAIRNRWYALEAAFRQDLPGRFDGEVEQVRNAVRELAIDAELVSEGGPGHGRQMLVTLRGFLQSGIETALPLETIDLLGCAYQLSDECEIWWSEKFDPATEAPWVEAQ